MFEPSGIARLQSRYGGHRLVCIPFEDEFIRGTHILRIANHQSGGRTDTLAINELRFGETWLFRMVSEYLMLDGRFAVRWTNGPVFAHRVSSGGLFPLTPLEVAARATNSQHRLLIVDSIYATDSTLNTISLHLGDGNGKVLDVARGVIKTREALLAMASGVFLRSKTSLRHHDATSHGPSLPLLCGEFAAEAQIWAAMLLGGFPRGIPGKVGQFAVRADRFMDVFDNFSAELTTKVLSAKKIAELRRRQNSPGVSKLGTSPPIVKEIMSGFFDRIEGDCNIVVAGRRKREIIDDVLQRALQVPKAIEAFLKDHPDLRSLTGEITIAPEILANIEAFGDSPPPSLDLRTYSGHLGFGLLPVMPGHQPIDGSRVFERTLA